MNEDVGSGKKDIVTENIENNATGNCPGCGSEDLVLTLEMPKGFRYKCNNCDETFVVEVKLLGENIKDLTQDGSFCRIPKIVNEIDERKTIKMPKKTYMQLESIRQDIGLTTLMDTLTYVVNEYKTRKEIEINILHILSKNGEKTVNLMNTFWADIQEDIKEVKTEIQDLKKSRALEWQSMK